MSYIGNRPTDVVGVRSGSQLPANGLVGELFFLTTDGLVYVYNGLAWVVVSSGGGGGSGFTGSRGFTGSAGTTSVSQGSALPGTGTVGELFFLTSDGRVYVWNSSSWNPVVGAGVGTSLPVSGVAGELFFESDTEILFVNNGSTWIAAGGGGGGGTGFTGSAGFTGSIGFTGSAGPAGTGFTGSSGFVGSRGFTGSIGFTGSGGTAASSGATFPVSAQVGDLFYNTTDGLTYVYTGTTWIPLNAGIPINSATSVSYTPTNTLATAFSAPSTVGRRYKVESVHVANTSASPQTISAFVQYSSNSQTVTFANEVPVPVGTSVELLLADRILNPSDAIRMQSSTSSSLSTITTYSDLSDTKLFGVGVNLGATITDIYVAPDKSKVDSILVANSSASDSKVTVVWTNGSNTTIATIAFELIVPANGTIELLHGPKVIPAGNKIRALSEIAGAIGLHISGTTV